MEGMPGPSIEGPDQGYPCSSAKADAHRLALMSDLKAKDLQHSSTILQLRTHIEPTHRII